MTVVATTKPGKPLLSPAANNLVLIGENSPGAVAKGLIGPRKWAAHGVSVRRAKSLLQSSEARQG